jgi:RimJ/RimL family protein N-acetyltransferase
VATTFDVLYAIEAREDASKGTLGLIGLYDLHLGRDVGMSLAIFDPADRRQGYGSRAIGLLLRALGACGALETVFVEVLTVNAPAERFWRKLGFAAERERGLADLSPTNRG